MNSASSPPGATGPESAVPFAERPNEPVSQNPVPRSPQLPRLFYLLFVLLGLLAFRYLVPYYVEEFNYAAARGRERAEIESAVEGLEKLDLNGLSTAFQLVSKRVGPSVVHIKTMTEPQATGRGMPADEFGFLFGQPDRNRFSSTGEGSGVIMDQEGYILTNNHVIEGTSRIDVSLSAGRTVRAVLIGQDRMTDLALIKIDTPGLSAADWGNSDDLDVGALVWAVGSPFGLDQSITAGILSGKNRPGLSPLQQFLQTDAAVNPGNSGGPLVDALGRVVGINTAIMGKSFLGLSFAIPSSIAREVYQELKTTGDVARGWLGVSLRQAGSNEARQMGVTAEQGAVIFGVVPGSPALKAGIQAGDVIVAWDGHEVDNPTTLSRLVATTPIDSKVQVVIWRESKELTLEVIVGRRPAQLGR
ncbi:MAG: serine protease [Planctomycetaceae bacterium]|nr:serine protease [Planctomycetaceae bacterium]MBP61780.1 serine protease [Planctomycetaceae bacterium]